LVRRKKRDIYGNRIWEDEDIESVPEYLNKKVEVESKDESSPILEWRDYVALVVASLETFLLPFVVLILILFSLLVFVTLLR